jgi:hypothetical protein
MILSLSATTFHPPKTKLLPDITLQFYLFVGLPSFLLSTGLPTTILQAYHASPIKLYVQLFTISFISLPTRVFYINHELPHFVVS